MHPDAQCDARPEHDLVHFIVVQVGYLYDQKSTVYTDADHWPGMVESGYECRFCGLRVDVVAAGGAA